MQCLNSSPTLLFACLEPIIDSFKYFSHRVWSLTMYNTMLSLISSWVCTAPNVQLLSSLSTQVRVTLTNDLSKIFKALQQLEPKGKVNFITGLRIAHVSLSTLLHVHVAAAMLRVVYKVLLASYPGHVWGGDCTACASAAFRGVWGHAPLQKICDFIIDPLRLILIQSGGKIASTFLTLVVVDTMFPSLNELSKICRFIPGGTASVERRFSQMMIKTRLRNCIGESSHSSL